MRFSLFIIIIILGGDSIAQGEYLWTTPITANGSVQEYGGMDLYVDDDNFIYITASYHGTVLDTSGISAPGNDFNVLVAKYDNYGQLIWATQLDGPEDDMVYGITVDNSKNVYIVGAFMDSLIVDGVFLAEAATSNEQLYVLKLNENGDYVWHFTAGYTTNRSIAYDIEVDNSQNCYVVGRFRGNLQLGNDTLLSYGGYYYKESGMYFKLHSNGTIDWYRQMQGTYDTSDETGTYLTNICSAGNDEYYIAGNFRHYAYFDADTIYTISSNGQYQDVVLGRINNQGDFTWTYHYGCANIPVWELFANVYNMETNDDGELCISGTWGGSDNSSLLTIDTFQFYNGWGIDIYFAKFTSEGNVIWAENVNGGNNADFPIDMALDPTGNYMVSAIMSQTNGFADTTISGLYLSHKGSFKVSGNDGSFIYYHHSYPSGDATGGLPPHYKYDQYGNMYTFGKANSIIGAPQSGLFLNKKSSGDVLFSGTVFHDANQDSIIDIGETLLPNILVVGDSGMFYKTTDSAGYYQMLLDTNDHYFEVIPPQYWYINYPNNPDGHATYAPYSNDSVVDLNFGLSMYPGIIDDQISVSSTNYVPGFQTKFTISYKNVGTDTSFSGAIKLIYSDTLIYSSTDYAYLSHVGDTIIWTYDSLLVGEQRNINIYFNVPANVGLLNDTLTSYASISPTLTDTSLLNNLDTISKVVVGAYDPNYKLNYPPGLLSPGYITEADSIFEYEIHFQNTGTDSAVNIVLVDTLDPNLDVTTFEMLGASHNVFYEINGHGVVTWTFENIMLPDSGINYIESQGFVKYKIKLNTPKPPSTIIKNTAYIYFDFNPPIITNTTLNTIYDCYDVPINISTTILCQNDTLIAFSDEGSMNDYNWYFDGSLENSVDTLVWIADSAYNFNLTLESSNLLCIKDTSLTIMVNPAYEIHDSSYVICQGDSLLLYGMYQSQTGTYYQLHTTTEGCDSLYYSYLTVENCTGLNEQNHFSVRVFPNPGRGIYTVEFLNSNHKSGIVRIFNINSLQVYYDLIFKHEDQWQIDIQDLENGVYFIYIEFEDGFFIEKLLKF